MFHSLWTTAARRRSPRLRGSPRPRGRPGYRSPRLRDRPGYGVAQATGSPRLRGRPGYGDRPVHGDRPDYGIAQATGSPRLRERPGYGNAQATDHPASPRRLLPWSADRQGCYRDGACGAGGGGGGEIRPQPNPSNRINDRDGERTVTSVFSTASGSAYPSAMPQTTVSSSANPSTGRMA
jgi:hypothetical protein